MNRNEAITLIEEYNRFLLKEGYVDTDIWCEEPTAMDGFLLSKWAKANLPLKDKDSTEDESIYATLYKTGMRKMPSFVENRPSIVHELMKDPEFQRKVEEIAQKLSDKYPEKK